MFDVGPKVIFNLLDKSLFSYSRPKQVRLPHSKHYTVWGPKKHTALRWTNSTTFNYGSETQHIVCSIPSLQREQRENLCLSLFLVAQHQTIVNKLQM